MADQLCSKWMPRAQAECARGVGHPPPCASPEAMERQRLRSAQRVIIYGRSFNPVVRARWRQAYKLQRYGLTQADFDRLLQLQDCACAMCHEPFIEDQPVFIDHDHACCPGEKSSCGKCVRGLLDLSCNTTLGHIERRYEMARAYLDAPPGQSLIRVERVA
jgi:hypothetical protein